MFFKHYNQLTYGAKEPHLNIITHAVSLILLRLKQYFSAVANEAFKGGET